MHKTVPMASQSASSIGVTYLNPSPNFAANSTSLPMAFHHNTLGFGFSGSGFLVFYFTGVVAVLRTLGIINNSTTLAGSSGGGLISVATCSQQNFTQQFQQNLEFAASCRAALGCRGSLGAKVADLLNRTLPLDAAEKCRHRVYLTLTRARPKNQTDVPLLVTNFRSRAQMISAAVGTSWLPFFSGPTATTDFSGMQVYDGGFANALPCPPSAPYPDGVTYCVKVSAAVPSYLASSNQANKSSSASAESKAKQSTLGFLIATAGNRSKASDIYLPLNPVSVPPPRPDIYPGLSGPINITADTWNSYGLLIPDNSTLLYIHNTGRRDASFWARRNGLVTDADVKKAMAATKIK